MFQIPIVGISSDLVTDQNSARSFGSSDVRTMNLLLKAEGPCKQKVRVSITSQHLADSLPSHQYIAWTLCITNGHESVGLPGPCFMNKLLETIHNEQLRPVLKCLVFFYRRNNTIIHGKNAYLIDSILWYCIGKFISLSRSCRIWRSSSCTVHLETAFKVGDFEHKKVVMVIWNIIYCYLQGDLIPKTTQNTRSVVCFYPVCSGQPQSGDILVLWAKHFVSVATFHPSSCAQICSWQLEWLYLWRDESGENLRTFVLCVGHWWQNEWNIWAEWRHFSSLGDGED